MYVAYIATDAEILVFLAVDRCDLLYELRIFALAHVVGVILDFHIRDSSALALAGEHGRCIQGGEPFGALVGAHGWRSLGVASKCADLAVLYC